MTTGRTEEARERNTRRHCIAVLAHIPGLKVVVPSTAYNAKGLTISAIRDNGPVVVLEHKFLGAAAKGDVPEEAYTVPIGKAEIIRRGRTSRCAGSDG